MNDALLQALRCQRTSGPPPVWLMRQAGRYLPSYRALRKRYSFLEMCHTPEIAAEVTLLPFRELALDAAILFSDILVVPEAMGADVSFVEGKGPLIGNPVTKREEINHLSSPNVQESLGYVAEAISLLKPQLQVPLIGFAGAPFTVASYVVEGQSSPSLKKTKQWMWRDPEGFHQLLDKIASVTTAYLNLQIDAGVDALQIFDSWAGHLAWDQFRAFSLSYLEKVMKGLKDPSVPVILFCRGSSLFAESLAALSPAAISIDWQAEIADVRRRIPSSIALQGNLDPDVLYGSTATITKEVQKMVASMQGDPGYIFNLGHGLKPDMSVDAVRALVDAVK